MSSELFVCDGSLYSDFFSPSSIDVLQPCKNPVDEFTYFDQIAPDFFSSSPPSHQLENLSLLQTTHLQNVSNSENPSTESSVFEVKTEESQLAFQPSYDYHHSFEPQSYSGPENAVKLMQISFSSNYFEEKPGFMHQSGFDHLIKSPNYHPQVSNSPIRKVCSTGDLQKMKTNHGLLVSPLAAGSSVMEGDNFKVGRYSSEERKERIHRYRAKRNHRNFNKTIKYACRKTLADSRPRIRGRFARNDEIGDTSEVVNMNMNQYKDKHDVWVDGFNEEEVSKGRPYFNCSGPSLFQYYSYGGAFLGC